MLFVIVFVGKDVTFFWALKAFSRFLYEMLEFKDEVLIPKPP